MRNETPFNDPTRLWRRCHTRATWATRTAPCVLVIEDELSIREFVADWPAVLQAGGALSVADVKVGTNR